MDGKSDESLLDNQESEAEKEMRRELIKRSQDSMGLLNNRILNAEKPSDKTIIARPGVGKYGENLGLGNSDNIQF